MNPIKDKMEQYFWDVRSLVLSRLTDAERAKVDTLPLRWAPYAEYQPLGILMLIWGRDFAPLGEALWSDDTFAKPDCVVVYSDGVRNAVSTIAERGIPFGRLVAFVLLHEMGHILAPGGHELPAWEEVVRRMGIDEKVYARKAPGAAGRYQFLDESLWASIRALSSYPGDAYPAWLQADQ